MTYFDDFEYFVTFSFIMDSVRFAPVPSTVDLVKKCVATAIVRILVEVFGHGLAY